MTEHKSSATKYVRAFRSQRLASRFLIASALLSAAAAAERPCPPSIINDGDSTVVEGSQACPTVSSGNSDTPDYEDPLASCSGLQGRRVVQVSTATAFQHAMSIANCGDTIQLAPGTYGAASSIRNDCPMTAPVIIQGAANFGSTITANMDVAGTRTVVTGINFSGSEARVRLGGTNNKVIGNRFTNWRSIAVTAAEGKQGEIAYNEFSRPHAWVANDSSNYPLRIGIRTAEKDPSNFHFDAWVHHNYFHDFPAKPDPQSYHSGQSDAIEVCQSGRESTALMRTGWYIESNLVERHLQGHGIIDLKCGGNVVRYNTVSDSPGGRLDARAGSYNVLESNWLENSGGSSIHGGYNKVVGNRVRGGQLTVMAGDLDWNNAGGGYSRALHTLVAGNDSTSLVIGKAYNSASQYPALDTTVEGHVGGKPVLEREQNTTISASTNVRFSTAFRLSPASVGPSALTGATNEYLTCRVAR